jgi:hypothetical protein
MGVGTLIQNSVCRKNAKGPPGLAFETWDPRKHWVMDTDDVTRGKRITVPAQ